MNLPAEVASSIVRRMELKRERYNWEEILVNCWWRNYDYFWQLQRRVSDFPSSFAGKSYSTVTEMLTVCLRCARAGNVSYLFILSEFSQLITEVYFILYRGNVKFWKYFTVLNRSPARSQNLCVIDKVVEIFLPRKKYIMGEKRKENVTSVTDK